VQHFLSNLDPVRYNTLLIELENRVNSGMANVYPATIALACELVIRWKPVLSYVTKPSSRDLVFMTKEENEVDTTTKRVSRSGGSKPKFKPPRFVFPNDKRVCGACDKIGHLARYCGYNELGLSQPTPEDKAKNEDYNARKAREETEKNKEKSNKVFSVTGATTRFDGDWEASSGEENGAYAFAF